MAGTQLRIFALLALAVSALIWPWPGSVESGNGLRFFARAQGREIGAAVRPEPLANEPLYAETLAREFSMLMPENALKWDTIHPEQNRYDFAPGDGLVAFAEGHDMTVFAHVLVWHWQLPSWLTEGNFSRDELIAVLHDHITTVVGHYRGRVLAWDVVNEAIADDGSLRDTFWLEGIGPEYIELAFQWAREADPDALLFYNDYGGEGMGTKSDAVYTLVSDLIQRGVPIDGVGLQMHVSVAWYPPPQDVAANMARLGALGLQVHISEMDVRLQESSDPMEERLAAQAAIYGDMMDVCLNSDNCTAFCTWGFTDKYSWIPWFTGNPDWPLPFDEDYRPKPAYYALLQALGGPIVGGIVEAPEAAVGTSEARDSSRDGTVVVVVVVAAVVVVAIALGGVTWHLRGRRLG